MDKCSSLFSLLCNDEEKSCISFAYGVNHSTVVFVPEKVFKANLIFVGKAWSLPKSAQVLHSGRLRPNSQILD